MLASNLSDFRGISFLIFVKRVVKFIISLLFIITRIIHKNPTPNLIHYTHQPYGGNQIMDNTLNEHDKANESSTLDKMPSAILENYLNENGDIHVTNNYGQSIGHISAINQDAQSLEIFFERGGNVNAVDIHKWSIGLLAVKYNAFECFFSWLINDGNLDLKNHQGTTAGKSRSKLKNLRRMNEVTSLQIVISDAFHRKTAELVKRWNKPKFKSTTPDPLTLSWAMMVAEAAHQAGVDFLYGVGGRKRSPLNPVKIIPHQSMECFLNQYGKKTSLSLH